MKNRNFVFPSPGMLIQLCVCQTSSVTKLLNSLSINFRAGKRCFVFCVLCFVFCVLIPIGSCDIARFQVADKLFNFGEIISLTDSAIG